MVATFRGGLTLNAGRDGLKRCPSSCTVPRLQTAPIFSQSVEREAKRKSARKLGKRRELRGERFRSPRPQFSRALFFCFASRSTDCEKIGAARSLYSTIDQREKNVISEN